MLNYIDVFKMLLDQVNYVHKSTHTIKSLGLKFVEEEYLREEMCEETELQLPMSSMLYSEDFARQIKPAVMTKLSSRLIAHYVFDMLRAHDIICIPLLNNTFRVITWEQFESFKKIVDTRPVSVPLAFRLWDGVTLSTELPKESQDKLHTAIRHYFHLIVDASCAMAYVEKSILPILELAARDDIGAPGFYEYNDQEMHSIYHDTFIEPQNQDLLLAERKLLSYDANTFVKQMELILGCANGVDAHENSIYKDICLTMQYLADSIPSADTVASGMSTQDQEVELVLRYGEELLPNLKMVCENIPYGIKESVGLFAAVRDECKRRASA